MVASSTPGPSDDTVASIISRHLPKPCQLVEIAAVERMVAAFTRAYESILLHTGLPVSSNEEPPRPFDLVLQTFGGIFAGDHKEYPRTENGTGIRTEDVISAAFPNIGARSIEDILRWGAKAINAYLSDYAWGFLDDDALAFRREVVREELSHMLSGIPLAADS